MPDKSAAWVTFSSRGPYLCQVHGLRRSASRFSGTVPSRQTQLSPDNWQMRNVRLFSKRVGPERKSQEVRETSVVLSALPSLQSIDLWVMNLCECASAMFTL